MSVKKSCKNCKHMKHGTCFKKEGWTCNEDTGWISWELSDDAKADLLHDAEPVVMEKAEPKKCENCFWYCRTCNNKESAFYGDVMGKSGYCVHHDYKSEETNMNPEQPAHDAVNHPNHYCKGGVECLDAIKAALGDKYEGFLAGNVLKYVYRYPDKNGVEDCKKARFYLDKLIEELSNEQT